MDREMARKRLKKARPEDLRVVVIKWKDGGKDRRDIVFAEEAEAMRVANSHLHINPGKNPHNGITANPADRIEIEPVEPGIAIHRLEPNGPYWWSTPDLQNNNDPRGAVILELRR